MQRRTLLQWAASAAAVLPFERIRLLAQPRELTPEAIAILREVAPTVLPVSLGTARVNGIVDRFVAWTRGYREGVPLAHGYGRCRKPVHRRCRGTACSLRRSIGRRGRTAVGGPRSISRRGARCSMRHSPPPASATSRRGPQVSMSLPI